MIKLNWKKSLVVAAAALAVAAAVPAVTLAKTAYTDVTPPADVLRDTAAITKPVKKATKHKTLKHKSGTVLKAAKKSTVSSKHKPAAKQKKTTAKIKTAV